MTAPPDLDAEEWRRILDAVGAEEPPALEVAEQLADAVAIRVADAQAAVYDAVDDGPLVEDAGAGGAFGGVRLAEDAAEPEPANTSDTGREDTDSPDATPGVEADVSRSNSGDGTHPAVTDERAVRSGRTFYPGTLRDGREWWIDWVRAYPYDDGGEIDTDAVPTKQPIAPYRNGTARPVSWHFGLDDDEHPSTDFQTVRDWDGLRLGVDLPAVERVISDTVRVGIIIPPNQDGRTITLLDWDDVRDPETEEVHPVAARALAECDGYAEVSQSGKGIHQFVFGEIPGGLKKFIRHIDDEPFVGDDRPALEMYQSGRVCAMTGEHVAGSGEDVVEDQALLDRLCWEFGTGENKATDTPADPFAGDRDDDLDAAPDHATVDRAVRNAQTYDGADPDEWDVREDRSLAYEAVLRARERSDDLDAVANWELLGYAAALGCRDGLSQEAVLADLKAHPTPQYGYDNSRARKEVRGVYRKAEGGNYNPPTRATLAERGILPERYAQTHFPVETCEPPAYDPDTFDRHERWEQLQGARYDAVRDHDGVSVWTDPPGSGKTTNAALGELRRDQGAALLFDKHEKAREVQTDDALPDGFDPFHLKGGAQKRHARCMDADHADEECSEHGHPSNCPSMCPVKDLDADHETRRRYEAVAAEVGDVSAHLLLAEDLLGHDDDGGCAWLNQFEEVERAEHVVGVHEYQRLKTVRDGRQTLVDESPSSLRETTYVDIEGLVRTANALADLADLRPRDDPTKYTAEHFAGFVNDLVDAATGDADLADLDPPAVVWNAYETYDDAAGNYVEREEPAEEWHTAEVLAQLKMAYSETIIDRIKREEWDGTPVGLDAVITAAAEAGLSTDAVRAAVATPTVLDSCPWCDAPLGSEHGARVCSSDTCDWDEREHTITQRDGERARAVAYLDDDPNTPAGLGFEQLPLASDLPDDPLILDATATPSKIAHLYGVDPDAVEVAGDDDLDANMRVTQVLDGQYHAGTVEESDTARERIQSTIDTAGRVHERPLFVIKKGLRGLFDFPEHGEILHYHAGRGLNRNDCDAVVCIGAPHPDVEDLKREAELLAQGTETRVGGAEHSTRRDAPNPPVYRKLNYEDDDGRGRAVPTKHYTGLVGELFRETREKEIEQMVHRARPLLAEDTVDVYLLTNVPTSLRVDTVCSFDELADPIQALLPVRDGALELLGAVERVARGDGPDGFRAAQLVDGDGETVSHKVAEYHRLARLSGLDVTERTVRNYIDDLDAVGLLDAEAYEHRAGRSYSVDRSTLKAALSVLSYNESFKVAAKRRLRENLDKAASIGEWLDWAKAVFGLGGDRCDLDPPPEMGPTRPTRAD